MVRYRVGQDVNDAMEQGELGWASDFNGDEVGYPEVLIVGMYERDNVMYLVDVENTRVLEVQEQIEEPRMALEAVDRGSGDLKSDGTICENHVFIGNRHKPESLAFCAFCAKRTTMAGAILYDEGISHGIRLANKRKGIDDIGQNR
jgi:hypothetical protein